MTESLPARVEAALATIVNSRTGADLVGGGQVRDVATTTDGKVRFTLLLAAVDEATLARPAALGGSQRLLAAAWIGLTRLIDEAASGAVSSAGRGAQSADLRGRSEGIMGSAVRAHRAWHGDAHCRLPAGDGAVRRWLAVCVARRTDLSRARLGPRLSRPAV